GATTRAGSRPRSKRSLPTRERNDTHLRGVAGRRWSARRRNRTVDDRMFGDDEVERNIPCPCVDVGNLLKSMRQPDEQGTCAARTQSERERRVVVAGAVPETNTPAVERGERDLHDV